MFGKSIFQFKTVRLVQEWLLSLDSCYEIFPSYESKRQKKNLLNNLYFLSDSFILLSSLSLYAHSFLWDVNHKHMLYYYRLKWTLIIVSDNLCIFLYCLSLTWGSVVAQWKSA